MKFMLVAIVLTSTPLETRTDDYVIDTGLTYEDCAQSAAALKANVVSVNTDQVRTSTTHVCMQG